MLVKRFLLSLNFTIAGTQSLYCYSRSWETCGLNNLRVEVICCRSNRNIVLFLLQLPIPVRLYWHAKENSYSSERLLGNPVPRMCICSVLTEMPQCKMHPQWCTNQNQKILLWSIGLCSFFPVIIFTSDEYENKTYKIKEMTVQCFILQWCSWFVLCYKSGPAFVFTAMRFHPARLGYKPRWWKECLWIISYLYFKEIDSFKHLCKVNSLPVSHVFLQGLPKNCVTTYRYTTYVRKCLSYCKI